MKMFPKLLAFALLLSVTSCYQEDDVIDDLFVSQGKVAQISVVWAGPTRGTTTVTVDAGTQVPVTIEYISEVDVKEIKLYQQVGTATPTLLTTLPATAAQYDAKLRNYVVKANVTAPSAKSAMVRILAEVLTTNDLPSARLGVTVRTRA
jgi:hypothetical protein